MMMISLSEKVRPLVLVFQTHFFSALATVKLDQGGSSTTTVAWMITLAELVEFCNHVLEILGVVVSENYSELLLHLFQENQSTEERRQEMILAFTQKLLGQAGFLIF
jgi:hypothetical protein